ncbi:retinol dehydrogenase 14 [Rhizodiscina lignyota]|uniref:Retinol dehydrogenase 14 n=1 Tax=Rhizodiscina lignyota TaxID=1504668 RepID=A0A9P4IN55_9PEZI|nr:retinol dehydrogenase 14 [Rhizodiscina lignyota]
MHSSEFNPHSDIQSLEGKVFLITGGTAGLGSGAIEAFAEHNPSHIFFTGRNKKSADKLISTVQSKFASVNLTFLECDQTSLASVREAANKFLAQSNRLDVLMCNAGVMGIDADQTKDGYEIQFGINHVAHALLIKLLLPTMLETAKLPDADVRIINMSSWGHKQAPSYGIQFETLKTSQASLGGMIPGPRWSRYGQSKLANLLYAQELAKRYPQITSVSVHPGFVMTGLYDNVNFLIRLPALISSIGRTVPVDQGHYNQVWATTCRKSDIINGQYYEPVGVVGKDISKAAQDKQLAERLWDWTQEELAGY